VYLLNSPVQMRQAPKLRIWSALGINVHYHPFDDDHHQTNNIICRLRIIVTPHPACSSTNKKFQFWTGCPLHQTPDFDPPSALILRIISPFSIMANNSNNTAGQQQNEQSRAPLGAPVNRVVLPQGATPPAPRPEVVTPARLGANVPMLPPQAPPNTGGIARDGQGLYGSVYVPQYHAPQQEQPSPPPNCWPNRADYPNLNSQSDVDWYIQAMGRTGKDRYCFRCGQWADQEHLDNWLECTLKCWQCHSDASDNRGHYGYACQLWNQRRNFSF
jgi:hypothetical protein